MAVPPPSTTEPTAQDIAAACTLSEAARVLLRNGLSADGYVVTLTRAGLARDALDFVAHWLPPREAVWWGCQCLWSVFRPNCDPATEAALQTVVRWVLEPNETTRRQCEAVMNRLTPAHPAGALALAAFASGGSLSAPDLPNAPAPPALTGTALVGALLTAAGRRPDPQPDYRQFVQLGLDVAHGRNLWS